MTRFYEWKHFAPVGNSLILAMWGKNSQPAVQIFGLGWSLGGVIGPLIAVPFVSTTSEADEENRTCVDDADPQLWLRQYSLTERSDLYNDDDLNSRSDRYPDESRIEVAFWIVSACMLFIAAMFVVLYVIFKPQAIGKRKKYDWKEIKDRKSVV